MAKAKKFGAFGGVFTPSILTILGVIMYLRFPMIIGQAGLYSTLAIIVIAHIISISTGLSVASIATDKKVKSGGTYYILSRSLGLPIGGTLGWALFVGLSFSVSLYLIGFAESFLSYWGFEIAINSVRITGTAILIVVTIITFISTSLAIKSQYFIMAAIALSLLSIFFGQHDFAPKTVNYQGVSDALPFMVLFGIFFPAVTGFEAGVSMSGDLKNAKKALPIGAMAAVGVGFIAYIGLAVFYANTVDRELLANDPQILFKIALVPELVIAGIWGATLSSAFGSILGAPRILQAVAKDKIAPKLFGKGVGPSNEPRNALLLSFAIAELGILIGELDVIARIVSMFFITTYAFLNMASAIESWASSDFRPSFKIPKFVSIIGSIACIVVMIQLDFAALIGAIIVLGILLFILKRKELTLESGDAWNSFWASIAKTALINLSKRKINIRNWRPNIVMFRANTDNQMYLTDLGVSMTGRLGMLTDFELITDKNKNIDTPLILKKKEDKDNYFKRKHFCNSVFEGIDEITSIYGFAGIEPNTVLMEWSDKRTQNEDLSYLLKKFRANKINAIFLNYNKDKGFGKKERIDIWWKPNGRHLSFSLALIKHLNASKVWKDAKIRILIINEKSSLSEKIYFDTIQVIEDLRINADIKIIENEVNKRKRHEIILEESINTDLVILGISENKNKYSSDYIQQINKNLNISSSCLFLMPSYFFKDVNVIPDIIEEKKLDESKLNLAKELPDLYLSEKRVINNKVIELDNDLQVYLSELFEKTFDEILFINDKTLLDLTQFVHKNLGKLELKLEDLSESANHKLISRYHNSFLLYFEKFYKELNDNVINTKYDLLNAGISSFNTKIGNYVYELPETILIQYDKSEFKANRKDSLSKRIYKLHKRLLSSLKNEVLSSEIEYRKLVKYYITYLLQTKLNQLYNEFGIHSYKFLSNLKNIKNEIDQSYHQFNESNFLKEHSIQSEKERLICIINDLQKQQKANFPKSSNELFFVLRSYTQQIINELELKNTNRFINKKRNINKSQLSIVDDNLEFADMWKRNMSLFGHTLFLEHQIMRQKRYVKDYLYDNILKLNSLIHINIINQIEKFQREIKESDNFDVNKQFANLEINEQISLHETFYKTYQKICLRLDELPQKIKVIDDSYISDIKNKQFTDCESIEIELHKTVKYYVDTEIYDPTIISLRKIRNNISEYCQNIKEIVSLAKFNLENKQTDFEENVETEKTQSIFNQVHLNINRELDKIRQLIKNLEIDSYDFYNRAFEHLNSYSIIHSALEAQSGMREYKKRKLFAKINTNFSKFKKTFNSQLVNLWYKKSKGMLYAQRILSDEQEYKTGTEQIISFIEEISPNRQVLFNLPAFYKNLFISQYSINQDYWINRKSEIRLLEKTIDRYKDGYFGGILITGERFSGKTTLIKHFAKSHFKRSKIYYIDAPVNIELVFSDLEKAIQASVKSKESIEMIFNTLPNKTVFVFDDLDLWWERRKGGYYLVNHIMELISKYSRNFIFIIACNIHTYRFINHYNPIDKYFIGNVFINPLDAKDIDQLVMLRHKSSGIRFKLNHRTEDNISQFGKAKLFNLYFEFSQGNAGIVLNEWVRNISSYKKRVISIKKPIFPNESVLEQMDETWLIYIAQFILHKKMTLSKLKRVFVASDEEIYAVLSPMQRTGIIELVDHEFYVLNKYIEPFLIKLCIKKDIL